MKQFRKKIENYVSTVCLPAFSQPQGGVLWSQRGDFSAMNLTVEILPIERNLDNYAADNTFIIYRESTKKTHLRMFSF